MEYRNEKLEEFCDYIRYKKVAIIGLGVSNIPLIDYLYELKADITVFDKREIEKIDKKVMDNITKKGIKFSLGEKYLSHLQGFSIIFRSPSCRPDLPEIIEELKRGAILTSEIEMLMELCPGKVIGVTGSDGKTTTTTLIYEILKNSGYHCYLGGNIGIPLFSKIGEMRPDDIVVLELSSFQLMNIKTSPHIAVVTNVSPNHLDIHKSYEEYIEAKKNIFKYQASEDCLILNYDNDITREFAQEANSQVVFFSKKHKLDDGVILDEGIIKICENKLRKHILNTKEMILRGEHNYENACAAIAATKTLAPIETQVDTILHFQGVEHRLEFVRECNGVKWYNDSIGTSPTRTMAGLNSFEKSVILIAGGYDKHLDYTPLAKPILEHVKSLILMGQTAPKIKEAVLQEMSRSHKEIKIYDCETLADTVQVAQQIARKGDIVLFSPASASFDLYKNFEERGNAFKTLVHAL